MFLLTASLGSLVVINATCACIALAVGFAVGVWFFGASESQDSSADNSDARTSKEVVRATERALMASSRLKDLANGIACDVGSHADRVEALNSTLKLAAEEGVVDNTALQALSSIVEANVQLQERLSMAEKQIEVQAAEIQSHETEARTDSLTGLANRRAFDDELGRRYAEWQRKGTPCSLLLMDIDYFKMFNDTHGHQAGDEVLRVVGKKLTDATRDMDVPCRYGGEEFAVIMPNTVSKDAKIVAERIRTMIERSVTNFENKVLKVTASVGLAEIGSTDDTRLLLKRTDEALYKSKAAGRNCGHLHTGETTIPITPGIAAFTHTENELENLDTFNEALRNLPDKKAFCDELRRRVAESHRFGVPLSVIFFQIDDYCAIRSEFGATVAHMTLDSVAESVMISLREMDLLSRGDDGQFSVMLPGSSGADARRVAARVQSTLACTSIPAGDERLQLKVLLGVAEVEPGDSVELVVERAHQEAGVSVGELQSVGV